MSKLSVMGSFTCRAGKHREMESVLAAMVEAARSEEGVEVYSYHRGEDDTYWFFAVMADEVSMKGHGQSEAMQAAMAGFGTLVERPPEMWTTRPVAAVGLGL